jgi:uncharacterized protein (TIGR00297 family)
MGLFALALRYLTWEQAALCALAALLFNLFVLPRIGRGIYRDSSKTRDVGIVAYPAMVLALILLFRRELDIVAVVWAMMAFGDPAASISGRLVGGPVLPWNPAKTWIGLLTNWAVGTVSSVLVLWFYVGRPPDPGIVAILLIGAALFAFLESVRTGLDDNIVPPIPTALAILSLSRMNLLFLALPGGFPVGAILLAAAVNLTVAFLTWRLRLVSRSGAVSGAILGFLVVAFGGWRHYGLLWAFFLLGTVATRLGYRRKKAAGLAESNEGRRGASNVWANCSVPLAYLMFGFPPIAFPAALAAALSDTLGTEVGTLYGRRAFSLLTFRRLKVGTPGAVSVAGTLASLVGAALMALAAWSLKVTLPGIVWLIVAGGFLGSLAESVVKDLGRRVGFSLDHDFANALNTFVGGFAAMSLGLVAYPIPR